MEDNATSAGQDSFRRRWHRLYLDTAELNEIGRNRIDQALLRDLTAACEVHAVILVVSVEHMRDAMKPGDNDAPGRLADAIEKFPLRGLVDIGPDAIEPWSDGAADIKIDPCLGGQVKTGQSWTGQNRPVAPGRGVRVARGRSGLQVVL